MHYTPGRGIIPHSEVILLKSQCSSLQSNSSQPCGDGGPSGTPGNVWRHLDCCNWCVCACACTYVCVCALTSSVQRPGMLLNIIQGTGHSLTAKNFLTPNIQGRGWETQLSMESPVHRKVRGLGNKLKGNRRWDQRNLGSGRQMAQPLQLQRLQQETDNYGRESTEWKRHKECSNRQWMNFICFWIWKINGKTWTPWWFSG